MHVSGHDNLMKNEDVKRLFFGMEINSSWPKDLPKGRLLDEAHRHLTFAFLGNIPYLPLFDKLQEFPSIPFKIGLCGHFDACLTLPKRHPHVVAWHIQWLSDPMNVIEFQKKLMDWLKSLKYPLENRGWLPHVTLCRSPFDETGWKKSFIPLPFYVSSIHLYESVGNLNYHPLWTSSIKPPFEEISHTADLAFLIRGENLNELFKNAFTALAFKAPEFIDFFHPPLFLLQDLDDLIIALNQILSKADQAIGSSMKAVSFHGKIVEVQNGTYEWEMIVDV